MTFIYSIVVKAVQILIKIAAFFSPKIKLFVNGRKDVFTLLKAKIALKDSVIWVHCASLGEFEQGRPILENLRITYPSKKIVLTFFSPSGYEVRKNYDKADVVCYLPLDTAKNVTKFLDIAHPEKAIFVKYEFWPNYLKELKNRNIKTYLISGIFRKNQVFFKIYGSWMRKLLNTFTHFFVQNKESENLLNSIGFNNVTLSGDTRFDRVFEIAKQNNKLNFISEFVNTQYTLVAGSTWKEDEDLLVNYINNLATEEEKFIIAPHNIKKEDIEQLKSSITRKVILYSEKKEKDLKKYQVFIIDTVGILTKIYSYANIAYVGGGYTKSGVHNTLEPATFGIPIIIGPNYKKFAEVKDLINIGGCFSVSSSKKLSLLLSNFYKDKVRRENIGKKSAAYVKNKAGATTSILKKIIDER